MFFLMAKRCFKELEYNVYSVLDIRKTRQAILAVERW